MNARTLVAAAALLAAAFALGGCHSADPGYTPTDGPPKDIAAAPKDGAAPADAAVPADAAAPADLAAGGG